MSNVIKEIGGYFELDNYTLPMLHEGALALNCGRNCLAYLIEAKNIRKLLMPRFICDSVINVARKYDVEVRCYSVGYDFEPTDELEVKDDEWLYLVNYYGQFDGLYYSDMVERHKRVIVDQTHAYYEEPISGADCIYTCRKYFGVADGAFLYTDAKMGRKLPRDESYNRMGFVLGRYERNAGEFFGEASDNNNFFDNEPIKEMSKLTKNLLHGIDYEKVKQVRLENFVYLHNELGGINRLNVRQSGTFMYPFMVNGGSQLRKILQKEKIYVPTLWPEMIGTNLNEALLADNILPLPIDQRYTVDEMIKIIGIIKTSMRA